MMVSVHPSPWPSPPNEMSACSAAKSGQDMHPGRVHCRASFSGMFTTSPSVVYTMTLPLTLIRAIRSHPIPSSSWILCCMSPSYVNDFEHSRPNVQAIRLRHLLTRRASIVPVTLAWQDIPTSATCDRPISAAFTRASGLAE